MEHFLTCDICGVKTDEYIILGGNVHHKDPRTCGQNDHDSRDRALIGLGWELGRQAKMS